MTIKTILPACPKCGAMMRLNKTGRSLVCPNTMTCGTRKRARKYFSDHGETLNVVTSTSGPPKLYPVDYHIRLTADQGAKVGKLGPEGLRLLIDKA